MSAIRMQDALPLFEQAAKDLGVDPAMAKAIFIAENSAKGQLTGDKSIALNTTSPVGAYGLGQVMPATIKGLIREGYLPAGFVPDTAEKQAYASVAAIKEMMKRVKNPLELAIQYNGGMKALTRFRETGELNPETAGYVQKIAVNHPEVKTMLQGTGGPAGDMRASRGMNANWNASASSMPNITSFADGAGGSSMGFPTDMLKNLTKVLQQNTARAKEILTGVRGVNEAAEADKGSAVANARALGDAEVRKVEARSQQEIEKIRAQRELLTTFGIDATDPAGPMGQILSARNKAEAQMAALQPELQALQSLDITKDPLGWLVGQFKLQATADKFNAAAGQFQRTSAIIATKQAEATRQANLQPANDDAIILESAAADAEIARANANIRADQIQGQMRQIRLSSLQTELQINNQVFSNMATELQFYKQAMEWEYEAGLKKEQEMELTEVNRWLTLQGRPHFKTYKEYQQLPQKDRAEMLLLAKSGSGQIAGTPARSLMLMYEQGALPSFVKGLQSEEARAFYDSLINTAAATASKRMQGGRTATGELYKYKTQEEAIEAVLDETFRGWAEQAKKSRIGDELPQDHPLRLRPNLAASSPNLANNPISKYIKSLPSGGLDMNENGIRDWVAVQVKDGAMTPQQAAAAMSEFFKQGYSYQVSSLRLPAIGANIKGADGRAGYILRGNRDSYFTSLVLGNRNVANDGMDMFNPAQAENIVVRDTARLYGMKALGPGAKETAGMAAIGPTPNPMVNLGINAMRNTVLPKIPIDPSAYNQTGRPSIYASPEEWAKYRESQGGGQ